MLVDLYTPWPWVKKNDAALLSITSQFSKFFRWQTQWLICNKLGFKYHVPLKYVVTLPCKIWMSENWRQSEIYIVINDKSPGSIAKQLIWLWLAYTVSKYGNFSLLWDTAVFDNFWLTIGSDLQISVASAISYLIILTCLHYLKKILLHTKGIA